MKIKGREYTTVAERVKMLISDAEVGGYDIITNIKYEGEIVRCVAKVSITTGEHVRSATGHAEEVRSDPHSPVNKTSAVENCETSAIGRALGFLGYGIAEGIATADEVIIAESKAKEKRFAPRYAPPAKKLPNQKEMLWARAQNLGLKTKEAIESKVALPLIEANYPTILERLEIMEAEMKEPFV